MAFYGAAHAADMPAYPAATLPVYTKAPPAAAGAAPSCTDPVQFVVSDCALSYYGITVYGTIDIGGGYETHGTPFNHDIITGVEELVQKNSNRPQWLLTPNGMT